jgi:deoxyribonuclease-4
MRLGFHLGIGAGFAETLAHARRLGCQALQIFSGNPRGWHKPPLDAAEVAAFRAALAAAELRPLIVHATYLINLAAPDEVWEQSLAALIDEARRAATLGAPLYVTHLGSHRGSGWPAGAARVAAALDQAAAETPPEVTFCLENTSGQQNSLGTTFDELARLVEQVRQPERLGWCLDTCHAFAAGYDLATAEGLSRVLDEFDRKLDLRRLKVVHLNDSRGERGGNLDRHAHIGEGAIGATGFRAILAEPRLRELPGILETPQKEEGDDVRNLATLRRLAGAPGAAGAARKTKPKSAAASKPKKVTQAMPKKPAAQPHKKPARRGKAKG